MNYEEKSGKVGTEETTGNHSLQEDAKGYDSGDWI